MEIITPTSDEELRAAQHFEINVVVFFRYNVSIMVVVMCFLFFDSSGNQ